MIDVISQWLISIPLDAALWCVVLVFIFLDVVFGTFKAIITKTVSSEKARAGVMHKMGFIIAMTLCTAIDIAQKVTDIGFSVPVLGMCSIMIIGCEIFSLCEHAQEMNPDLDFKFLHRDNDN